MLPNENLKKKPKKRKILKSVPVEESVYDLTIERINHCYDLFDNVLVSFSGGKDSTVTLQLTLQVARERGKTPLRVVFFDEEAIAYDVEDYIRRLIKNNKDIALEWYCIPIKHTNACNPEDPVWFPWAPEKKHLWVRPMPPEAITEIPGYDHSERKNRVGIPSLMHHLITPDMGRSVIMMGIRAEESLTRRRAVSMRDQDNYIIQQGRTEFGGAPVPRVPHIWKAYPIYDWRTPDVWTAPNKYGWDYCTYYDKLEMLRVPHPKQRLAPPFGSEPMQALWSFARVDPELWSKMVDRVPGANTGALYARTQLYAFDGLPEKPAEVTWEEFIALQLSQHARNMRVIMAKRIRDEVAVHYKKTSDPITMVEHPFTGISWPLLLRIAVRGDLKKRIYPTYDPENPAAWERYEASRKEFEDEKAGKTSTATRF